jgi:hypothetical protein
MKNTTPTTAMESMWPENFNRKARLIEHESPPVDLGGLFSQYRGCDNLVALDRSARRFSVVQLIIQIGRHPASSDFSCAKYRGV